MQRLYRMIKWVNQNVHTTHCKLKLIVIVSGIWFLNIFTIQEMIDTIQQLIRTFLQHCSTFIMTQQFVHHSSVAIVFN